MKVEWLMNIAVAWILPGQSTSECSEDQALGGGRPHPEDSLKWVAAQVQLQASTPDSLCVGIIVKELHHPIAMKLPPPKKEENKCARHISSLHLF